MGAAIRLRGVRQNNLKQLDLDIPVNELTVITGVSGSGKSSLAFDTLFAEGQRRYIETFSPYARQFFDRMDKPKVDRIEGIPPAIAIEQKNTVKSTRSTVGTMTEICDYMKDLWLHFAKPYCEPCDRWITRDSPEAIWRSIKDRKLNCEVLLVVFCVPLSRTLGIDECLRSIISQGYQRCLFGGEVRMIDELIGGMIPEDQSDLEIIQDRIRLNSRARSRFIEACEQAFSFGKERLRVAGQSDRSPLEWVGEFSRVLECSECHQSVPMPTRSLFSFNSPVGACSTCRGFGRVIGVDYHRAIPDPAKTLAGGAVKLWQSGHGLRSQRDMMKIAKRDGIPTNIPFCELKPEYQDWVTYGTPGYGEAPGKRWPNAWYGMKGYFDWLESKAYKMHYRVLLSRYRAYYECSDCQGARFKPAVSRFRVAHKVAGRRRNEDRLLKLSEFYQLPSVEALAIVSAWRKALKVSRNHPLAYAIDEVSSRLEFIVAVGLGYLTLDRPTKTLSGGETERINLTSCLGTRLVNTLFVLDEPSVGLHAVDVDRLISILKKLRDAGNTVVVVEHDAAIIRAADYVVDIGPRSGRDGGALLFAGKVSRLLKSRESITATYLDGRKRIDANLPVSSVRPSANPRWLSLAHATRHNLKELSVKIPLQRFVCLTGVSGSGKTTLVKEVLYPELERLLKQPSVEGKVGESETMRDIGADGGTGVTLDGYDSLEAVIMVDQSPVGKTPRSNPAVYIGVFEHLRKLFASATESQEAGMTPGSFSFNSPAGRCDRCRGAGFEKIEMQFLSDVFIECPDCGATRYRCEVREFGVDLSQFHETETTGSGQRRWTITQMLDATVDETVEVIRPCTGSVARRALMGLEWLQAAGLGYLRLGQPINTLSGGESQRLKVVKHLSHTPWGVEQGGRTLFIFDEPTTGLHFSDVNGLLKMFRQMVRNGHSLLVVEHHLDLIRNADWMIDLGPGAGAAGGQIVYQGHPGKIKGSTRSQTGKLLNSGSLA